LSSFANEEEEEEVVTLESYWEANNDDDHGNGIEMKEGVFCSSNVPRKGQMVLDG
jgi:hypothetical protein